MMKTLLVVLLAVLVSVQAFAPATPVFGAGPAVQVRRLSKTMYTIAPRPFGTVLLAGNLFD